MPGLADSKCEVKRACRKDRTFQRLSGDEDLTPEGEVSLEHLENALGEGFYAGHAFALKGQLSRDESGLNGPCHGHID